MVDKVSIYIKDEQVSKKFDETAKKKNIKISVAIEQSMKLWIEENEKSESEKNSEQENR